MTGLERRALAALDPGVLATARSRAAERGALRRVDDRIWAVTTLRPWRTGTAFAALLAVPTGLIASWLTEDDRWLTGAGLAGLVIALLVGVIGRHRLVRYTLPMLGAITDPDAVPPFLEAQLAYLASLGGAGATPGSGSDPTAGGHE